MMKRSGSDGVRPTDQGVDGGADWRDEERCVQLKKLSREQHGCIAFAEKIARIAKEGTDADLHEGIALVRDYNERELEAHLQHEEQTIFGPLVQHHKEHLQLCVTLGKEHGYLRTLVEEMRPETAGQDLGDFAWVSSISRRR